jgi:bifunctional NMN adenylyltransferase/nudix hydrolase
MTYDVGVLIGRFQTADLHPGHRALLDYVCARHEKVVVFLGVSPLWATTNNPLDFQAREQMLHALYPELVINYIADVGSDEKWSGALDRQIQRVVSPAQSVVLYGSRDSFIPHYEGKYPTQEIEAEQVYSATAERKLIAAGNTKATADFRRGVIWATQARYPTSFQAVDIACLSEDGQKILLGRKPDEDHWRFFGGFVDPEKDDSLEAAASRELSEESGIVVAPSDLRYVGSTRIDDWRYRSERDQIMSALFIAKGPWGHFEPGDDIAEVKVFDLALTLPIVNEHEELLVTLWNHITKTAKGA